MDDDICQNPWWSVILTIYIYNDNPKYVCIGSPQRMGILTPEPIINQNGFRTALMAGRLVHQSKTATLRIIPGTNKNHPLPWKSYNYIRGW